MENTAGIQKYLVEIENDLKDVDSAVKTLSKEIDFLICKQGALRKTLGYLKELCENDSNNELPVSECKIDITKQEMAREIVKDDKKVIQLKNGQASFPFEEVVNLTDFNIPSEGLIEFDGIDHLDWNTAESKFEGTPVQPGEFTGAISYWLNEEDKKEGKPAAKREVHFLVNPDPRTLWQNIDPPQDTLYFKENSAFALEKCRERTIVGMSVRGKSHAHKGTFRDDDFAINCWNDNGWILQVVADGAGSAEYSRQGSKIACETTVAKISAFLESDRLGSFEALLTSRFANDDVNAGEEIGKQIYQITVGTAFEAHKAISKFAEEKGSPAKSFATTLLFSLSKKFDFGTIVISFSVGDGAIGVLNGTDASLLMTPDGGEFSGQTRFLTMPEIFKPQNPDDIRKRYGVKCFSNDVTALILMTDGISDPKFGTDNNLKDPKCWNRLWEDLKGILTDDKRIEKLLLDWMDFYLPGEYDDRTISILF
ncbi:protein phosphatase 2C domain-containing protein [Marinilabiliaceae bacterium JC017]|nr:protein phosphatase 2C domain-containing protein [Marinilabiliaceae bacterium JC017]